MRHTGPRPALDALQEQFADRMQVRDDLSRMLVSAQGNRREPGLRWMRYKEGYSRSLVEKFLPDAGHVLDPFAGTGITGLTAARKGLESTTVELLPIGQRIAHAVWTAARHVSAQALEKTGERLLAALSERPRTSADKFPHITITQGAFSSTVERDIASARGFLRTVKDRKVASLLDFAVMASLEHVSYTRKDGQYLRWDRRSKRARSKVFDKGALPSLHAAVEERLKWMVEDMVYLKEPYARAPRPTFIQGSALEELTKLPEQSVTTVITSPPYANRYDYTRVYALELAWLGHDSAEVKQMRQNLLSATVENRSKREWLASLYGDEITPVLCQVEGHPAIKETVALLTECKERLANAYVIRLVRNYLIEMAVVIAQIARTLMSGGMVYMVNDNVRYAGIEVPIDLILCDLAESMGLRCGAIWMLPQKKGNSSQQMARYGRHPTRKCVYQWIRD